MTSVVLRLCVSAVVVLLSLSCSSQPTDVRALVPGDALVYLETQDLGKALHAVTDNDAFRAAAKSQPDFSALNGIKVGVAVTGFETKEEKVSDESSVLNFQPRFVAVAETNAWNYQAIKFAENKLGEFVNDIYGGGVELERFPRYDGDYFVWTADDGRKAFGLVIGSVLFFANDETAIEKCVAVRKGEGDSMAKSTRFADDGFSAPNPTHYLASGFVSEQGVAQISNLASVQLAMGLSEESEVRSFIAKVLPEVTRNSVKGVTWTSSRSNVSGKIFDHFTIELEPELAKELERRLRPTGGQPSDERAKFIPADVQSVTSYTIADTGEAWEAIVENSRRNLDPLSSGLISTFADSLFDAYAIENPSLFLGAVSSGILTARFDSEEDSVVVVALAEDMAAVKRSVAKEISFAKAPQMIGDVKLWRSDDGDIAFANVGNLVVAGNAESVLKAIAARTSGRNHADGNIETLLFSKPSQAVLTASKVSDPDARLVRVLDQRAEGDPALTNDREVTTSMKERKLVRVEMSNFGLIGSIIEQLAKEQ